MWTDLLIQAFAIVVTIFMFLWTQNIPQSFLTRLRDRRNRPQQLAKRHFILGAQLLSKSKSTKNRTAATSLAKSAVKEADESIGFDPRDAAAWILKSMALDVMGLKAQALEAMDEALQPRSIGSLSEEERGEALFKRAELKVGLSRLGRADSGAEAKAAVSRKRRGGRVDSAVEDLVDSVRLKKDNVRAFCLLGDCYEKMGRVDEAKKAFEDGLQVQPDHAEARAGLDRLSSVS